MTETVRAVLSAARKALNAANIDTAALDARLLFQAATGLTHEIIVAEPERILSKTQLKAFENFLKRRLADEPVSRILGDREFYGRRFQISSAVLDPRADTETLIELALEHVNPFGQILDIGTGSGIIAVTLLAERPNLCGMAVDVSAPALQIAKTNAFALGVSSRLQFHCGSWFERLHEKYDLIVSNPPYIPHNDIADLNENVKNYDPHIALDGGPDGLFAYRAIAAGAAAHLNSSGLVILEIGAGQAADVTTIFETHGFQPVANRQDLGGHLRALAFNHQIST